MLPLCPPYDCGFNNLLADLFVKFCLTFYIAIVHGYNSIIMNTAFDLNKILLNNFFKFDLTNTCKLVLLSLVDCYNPKNKYVFPKQSTIAKKLGITEKSVKRAIKALEKLSIISKTRKFYNVYMINIKEILNKVQIDLSKVTNLHLERDKLSPANITNKEKIKEQDFDKNFSLENSDAVEKTQKLLGSFKAMELKEDYKSWNKEQAVRHLVKVIPAAVLKKSTLAKYLMDKFSISINEIMELKKS